MPERATWFPSRPIQAPDDQGEDGLAVSGQPSRSMVAENRNEGVYDRDRSQPQADSSSDSNTGAPLWSSASGYAQGSQAADTYKRL